MNDYSTRLSNSSQYVISPPEFEVITIELDYRNIWALQLSVNVFKIYFVVG